MRRWILPCLALAGFVAAPPLAGAQQTQSPGTQAERNQTGTNPTGAQQPMGTQQQTGTQQQPGAQQKSGSLPQATRSDSQMGQQQTGAQASGAGTQGGQQVNGSVTGVRTIRIEGESQPHLLARVQIDGGQTRILDLGPLDHLSDQKRQVKKNQQVKASGKEGRINDIAVLVVDRFEGDGVVTMIPIAASSQQERRQARGNTSPRDRTIEGDLVELRQTRIRGSDKPHQLAKVRTNRNQTVIVDLGPAPTEGLQLEKGDALVATGSIGRLDGKPVLFADRVAELERIERPDRPSVSSGPRSAQSESGDAAARQNASSQP